MYAVTCEHVDVVRALVAAGADQAVPNSDGETVQQFGGVPEDVREALSA